ncbi:MAG: hypothetical protein IJ452_00220, partial [Butyricicoccus sp.]|nr:hypothetical protein [Butyricicoccus sp.]
GTDGSYTVQNVSSDLTITVEGVVEAAEEEVIEPVAILTGGRKPHKSFGYVDTITIDQVKVTEYKWVGDHAYITLSDKTADDAAVSVKFKTGGHLLSMSDTTVTLADGKAEKAFTAQASIFGTWNFTLHFTNEGYYPALAAGVEAAAADEVYAGSNYTLDLSTIFSDALARDLTYYAKVDDGEFETLDSANYSVCFEETGVKTLTFKAATGDKESPTYTVTLTILEASYVDVEITVPTGVNAVFYAVNKFENGKDVPGKELEQ